MRFQVPQFIDVEDKIFGPFTFKQFVYLAGGAGASYALWKILPTLIAIPVVLFIIALAVALTFYKINGKPFIEVMQAYFIYILKGKLFIWKQSAPKKQKTGQAPKKKEAPKQPLEGVPKLTERRLADLSWSLDVLDMQEKEK